MSWRTFAAAVVCGTAVAQLPPVQVPARNPLTAAKIVLGKILFWEEQLSSDDSVACGTCHVPEAGGTDPRGEAIHPGLDGLWATDDDIRGTRGVVRQAGNGDFTPDATFGLRVQVTRRYAGTTHGAAYHDSLFWDGRASPEFTDPETNQALLPFGAALESQALGPILSPVEMGHEGRTWQDVRSKLQNVEPMALARNLTPDVQAALLQHATYPALFHAAFGDPAITASRIAFAIASYERTLIPDQTPWDRFMAGQTNALTANQQAGWVLFQGAARCVACHLDPLFQDDQFHNLGLRSKSEDRGVGPIHGVPSEDGSFKTPTLRNAGLRLRLFHNGQSGPLADPSQVTDPASVLNIYLNGGGVDRGNLDPFLTNLAQLGVTVADLQLVLDFVQNGLTDPRAAQGLPPFDHPQLRSMSEPPPLVFGPALAGASEPFFVDTVPAWPGNHDWKLGLVAGDGSTMACIGYGLDPMPAGLSFGGVPWHVQVLDARLVLLAGPAGAPGHATWRLAVPDDPNLLHYDFYTQLWALDALAPHGISTSRGTRFRVR